MTYLRKQPIYQAAVVAGFLCAVWTIGRTQEVSPEEAEAPIRFGDPETFLVPAEEIPPTVVPTPPAQALPLPTPATTATPEAVKNVKPKIAADRVREIILSVPAGDEYPTQFNELVVIGPEAVPTLTEIYSNAESTWQSRWIAAMALGRLGGESARLALEQGLTDPLFLIRLAAAQALGKTQDPEAAKALRSALSDRAMVVRSAVVDSLAELKDRDAIPLLRAELSAERSFYRGRGLWIREHIVDALSVIGGHEAVDTLVSLLKDEDPVILLRSCAALSKLAPEAPPAKETDLSPGVCAEQWQVWHESAKPTPAPTQ